VVDEWQPVSAGFELLPKADLLCSGELFQAAGFNCVDQYVECGVESIQGHIQSAALRVLSALSGLGAPELGLKDIRRHIR
jgi:hypothetical protein